jgi:tetratricopeptide (TPR) repeat protein
LRGLVSARVGKLSAAHRVILQLAVTFGPRFAPELLARAAGQDEPSVRQALSLLEERGIVRGVGPSDYAFAHDLVREVLYDSIPLEERPSLHAAVAQAIEALPPADVDAVVDRLAYHHRAAGNRRKAAEFLERAARRWEVEQALDAAVDAYLQAIELVSQGDSPDRAHLLRLYARVGEVAYHSRSAELVAERLASALELAEKMQRNDHVARFCMMRGRLYHKASRLEEGRTWLERAQVAARRQGDRSLERDVALAAAEALARNGEYTSLLPYVHEALELARLTGDLAAQLRCLLIIAPTYAVSGQDNRAREALAEVDRLTAGRPERPLEVDRERVRALTLYQLGDREACAEAARRAFELAKEYGFAHDAAVSAHMLGEFYLRGQEESRAFAALQSSIDIATEHGFTRVRWLNVCLLGFLDVLRFGTENDGLSRMREALRYAGDHGYVWDSINGQYLLAMAEQRTGSVSAARRALTHVQDLAQRHGHRRMAEDAGAALRALDLGETIALPR